MTPAIWGLLPLTELWGSKFFLCPSFPQGTEKRVQRMWTVKLKDKRGNEGKVEV